MKILVGVKRVVDYAVKVRVSKNGTIDLANVKQSMNPFCEIAVEEAVRLKEAKVANEIIAVSIGPKQCTETLRTALAMGCDRAIHVETNQRTDYMELQPTAVSNVFHHICVQEHPDLILLGKQSIDSDCGQVGSYLAAIYQNIPAVTYAAKIHVMENGQKLQVERETDNGTETIEINQLPAVITCDLRLNEPRYASLPNIMKAKKKKVDVINADELVNIDLSPTAIVTEIIEPPARKAGIMVPDVDTLIDKLKNEAKVI